MVTRKEEPHSGNRGKGSGVCDPFSRCRHPEEDTAERGMTVIPGTKERSLHNSETRARHEEDGDILHLRLN